MNATDLHWVFKRSARNFDEFARARKVRVARNLSYGEARDMCQRCNANRTPAQIRRGTKWEFDKQ